MNAQEEVERIKQDMARYSNTGEASRFRGIIVAPEVWQALKEDTEDFHGVIRIRGREGNRSLRYSFYVLENTNFPHDLAGGSSYFFVSYPKSVYRKRYLGREKKILSANKRQEISIESKIREFSFGRAYGEEVKIICLNPITGTVAVEQYGRKDYFYHVDFEEMAAVARQAADSGESISDALRRFDRYHLINNPPKTSWIKDECTYNYHKADVNASVGRLLMKRIASNDRRRPYLYRIVGIAINAHGRIVEVVMPDSGQNDPYMFACFAADIFLPEEIADFLSQFGVKITPEWVAQIPVKENWGASYDPEEIGRLRHLGVLGEKDTHIISGNFISTRTDEYSLDLARVQGEEEWRKVRGEYFPEDWEGWPATVQDKALKAFAQTL